MKAKKCRLIFHGIRREIDGGIFDSIAAAKRATIYWERPYTIRLIEEVKK